MAASGDASQERTQVSVRMVNALKTELEDEAEEHGVSRSEYIRRILRARDRVEELETELERLRDCLESRENRINELEEQLARCSQVEAKLDTLTPDLDEAEQPGPPFFFVVRV